MNTSRMLLLAAGLACAGAGQAQVDLSRGGPISTLDANPKPLQYVSQSLARNLSAGTRYFDDLYALSSATSSNLNLVPDPLGSNRQVFRMKLLKSDPLVNGGSRTEVTLKYEYVIEGVRWYAMSVLFPPDWQFNIEPSVVTQLHTSQKTTVVPPPVSITATNNDLNLELYYNYRNMNGLGSDPATRANTGQQTVRLGKFVTNKWYCFVFRVDWSYKPGTGSLSMWLNGNQMYDAKNAYNAYETWLGNYPKVGVYQPGVMSVPARSIYTDFIHVGGIQSTYEQMAALTPCGVYPQPLPPLIK
ncbi:MAG: polysaccharide lyase [Pseudomonadota bacterium]